VTDAFDDSDFADQRRRERILQSVTAMTRYSEASMNEVARNWAEVPTSSNWMRCMPNMVEISSFGWPRTVGR
jgi:hypothetical protein